MLASDVVWIRGTQTAEGQARPEDPEESSYRQHLRMRSAFPSWWV